MFEAKEGDDISEMGLAPLPTKIACKLCSE